MEFRVESLGFRVALGFRVYGFLGFRDALGLRPRVESAANV